MICHDFGVIRAKLTNLVVILKLGNTSKQGDFSLRHLNFLPKSHVKPVWLEDTKKRNCDQLPDPKFSSQNS